MLYNVPLLKRKLEIGEKVKFGQLTLKGEFDAVVERSIYYILKDEVRVFIPSQNRSVGSCLVLEREPAKDEFLPASHWQYCYPIKNERNKTI